MSQIKNLIRRFIPPSVRTRVLKRIWKPLDVGGLRLYEVRIWFPNKEEWDYSEIVAATSPTDAARIWERMHKGTFWIVCPVVKGYALNICMPEEWWDDAPPCYKCEPHKCR